MHDDRAYRRDRGDDSPRSNSMYSSGSSVTELNFDRDLDDSHSDHDHDDGHKKCCHCSKWTIIVSTVLIIGGLGMAGYALYKTEQLPAWLSRNDRTQEQSEVEHKEDLKEEKIITSAPSFMPTAQPSFMPTAQPSFLPTTKPSSIPTIRPTAPSDRSPSMSPSKSPSLSPSPSYVPTVQPSFTPTTRPSSCHLNTTNLPNVDQVAYTFNALLGKPPPEQLLNVTRSKMFEVHECSDQQLKEIHHYTNNCTYEVQGDEISWATSRASLEAQTSILNKQSGLNMSVPINEEWADTSESTILNALVLGNSESSRENFSKKESGFTYSFSALAKDNLYSVEVDYDKIAEAGAWTEDFKNACSSLGKTPTQTQLLQFFEKHGTHGLKTASFGQKCKSTVFMDGEKFLDSYKQFRSGTTYDKEALEWQYQSSNPPVFYNITSRCDGGLKQDFSCVEGARGTGNGDSPSINDWTFKPIWEMEIPGFTLEAQAAMKNLVEDITKEAVNCASEHCNGYGACVINSGEWKTIASIDRHLNETYGNLKRLFHSDRCFCFDDMEGDKCNEPFTLPRDYYILEESSWKKEDTTKPMLKFDYGASHNHKRAAISGIHSEFFAESGDRSFTFMAATPYIKTNVTGHHKWQGEYNVYGEDSTVDCPKNQALTRIHSQFSTKEKDRRWKYQCINFLGWNVEDCSWTVYVNEWKEDFVYFADTLTGRVIAGVKSVYSDRDKDRKFKFKSCRLRRALTLPPLNRMESYLR